MNECCYRCGNEIVEQQGTFTAGIQVATYGTTTQDYGTGEHVIPAGTWVHGDSWYQLCGDCYKKWQEWFLLFLDQMNVVG